MSGEAPHVTRQVQLLQQAGYADSVPDPGDRRAHLIQLTPAGTAAAGRIREAGISGMQAALAYWPPQERHQLATLLHRMVDDFLAYAAAEEPVQPEPRTTSIRQASHAPAVPVPARLGADAERRSRVVNKASSSRQIADLCGCRKGNN